MLVGEFYECSSFHRGAATYQRNGQVGQLPYQLWDTFCPHFLTAYVNWQRRWHILKLKCTKFDFGLERSPDPLAGFQGPNSKGKGGKRRGEDIKKGQGRRGGKGMGRKGKGYTSKRRG